MVREATEVDLPEILRVVNLAYQVEAHFKVGDRTSFAELTARFARPEITFFVIEAAEPGRLAASVSFEVQQDRAYFGLLAVDPSEQGRGHAKALIEAMEGRCRELGLEWLELDIVHLRTELPGFYSRFGFSVCGVREFHSPERVVVPVQLIVMEKQIMAIS